MVRISANKQLSFMRVLDTEEDGDDDDYDKEKGEKKKCAGARNAARDQDKFFNDPCMAGNDRFKTLANLSRAD